MRNPLTSILDRIRPKVKVDPPAPGLHVCLLQKRLERYTTDRMNAAMQVAWGRAYDRSTFFGMNLNDEHCIVKFGEMYIPVYFHERRLGAAELGDGSLPGWADQDAFTQIVFKPGGGLPTKQARHQFTGFVALLAIELANDSTTGFFFQEDGVFLRRSQMARGSVLAGEAFDPATLA